jgi:hypothetical protein
MGVNTSCRYHNINTLPLSFDGTDYIQCYQQLSKWNDQHRNVQDACTWDDDVIFTYDTCNSIGILNPYLINYIVKLKATFTSIDFLSQSLINEFIPNQGHMHEILVKDFINLHLCDTIIFNKYITT